MSRVFAIAPGGRADRVAAVRCRDEDRELQQLLERNPDLLPGDQIQPDDPCRWLLVRREMPIPSPATGSDWWSIDHVFADHNAIPTLVECKRFADTRSRREVIGQVLEYAANAQHYWEADDVRGLAEATARDAGRPLDEALAALDPDGGASAEEFFAAFIQNLREGRLRLVFFLEEAPFELKSIVEFLNRQMERAEVLIVEARQYELDGRRLVVPSLFGFTEEARRVKRAGGTSARGRSWTRESFLAAAREQLSGDQAGAVERVLAFALEPGFQCSWGRGKTGSLNVIAPDICRRSLFSLFTDGRIVWNFGWLSDDDRQSAFRDDLAERLTSDFGAELPPDVDGRWPWMRPEDWASRVEALLDLLSKAIEEHRKAPETPAVG